MSRYMRKCCISMYALCGTPPKVLTRRADPSSQVLCDFRESSYIIQHPQGRIAHLEMLMLHSNECLDTMLALKDLNAIRNNNVSNKT